MSHNEFVTVMECCEEQEVICFCFGYTKQQIVTDVRDNGRSRILERIITEKRNGGCHCAEKNPNGR